MRWNGQQSSLPNTLFVPHSIEILGKILLGQPVYCLIIELKIYTLIENKTTTATPYLHIYPCKVRKCFFSDITSLRISLAYDHHQ